MIYVKKSETTETLLEIKNVLPEIERNQAYYKVKPKNDKRKKKCVLKKFRQSNYHPVQKRYDSSWLKKSYDIIWLDVLIIEYVYY